MAQNDTTDTAAKIAKLETMLRAAGYREYSSLDSLLSNEEEALNLHSSLSDECIAPDGDCGAWYRGTADGCDIACFGYCFWIASEDISGRWLRVDLAETHLALQVAQASARIDER